MATCELLASERSRIGVTVDMALASPCLMCGGMWDAGSGITRQHAVPPGDRAVGAASCVVLGPARPVGAGRLALVGGQSGGRSLTGGP